MTRPTMDPLTPVDTEMTPTPEDVIGLCLEQCREAGMIGFDTDWRPERSAELITIDNDFDNMPPARQAFHNQATSMYDEMMELDRRWEREKPITKLLANNLPVVKSARAIVDQRLLAAGMSQKSLSDIRKTTLHGKLRILYGLEHPQKQVTERVNLYLNKDGGKTLQAIRLPKRASLAEITDILHDLSFVVDANGDPVNLNHGKWMYQLMNKANKVLSGRFQLSVDAGYQDMVKQVTMPGSATPSAVLFQVGCGFL